MRSWGVPPSPPVTVHVYCRLTVTVHDPDAVTSLAVRQLREADIDWAAEADDLESAATELGSDLLNSLAGLADPDRMLTGVPGIEFKGARIWAGSGRPDPQFEPGHTSH